MKNIDKIVKTAITSILAASTLTTFATTATAATDAKMEKCYGVVKAAMNDCQTATQGCAGSATKDKQADAFILLPKGTCNKLFGASLTAGTEEKTK